MNEEAISRELDRWVGCVSYVEERFPNVSKTLPDPGQHFGISYVGTPHIVSLHFTEVQWHLDVSLYEICYLVMLHLTVVGL